MSSARVSPLLSLPGAVAGDGVDAPVAGHYGSFNTEQRTLESGEGFVDLSHRDVIRISGPERLTWLHSLTTQHFLQLAPKEWTTALILSPQGHVEHAFSGYDDGESFWAHTEPGAAGPLLEWLGRMVFMTRVELAEVTDDWAVPGRSRPDAPTYDLVPRGELETYAQAAGPACGLWAFEALRIARGEPRHLVDTDARTIPNEVGWIGPAVHLDKGCYRGQETVARVHTLGRPPRRLTLLHLDGTENRLPAAGTELLMGSGEATKSVGFVGSSARHHELGPIALALVKRNVPLEVTLEVDGMPAAQEVVVDPEGGSLRTAPGVGVDPRGGSLRTAPGVAGGSRSAVGQLTAVRLGALTRQGSLSSRLVIREDMGTGVAVPHAAPRPTPQHLHQCRDRFRVSPESRPTPGGCPIDRKNVGCDPRLRAVRRHGLPVWTSRCSAAFIDRGTTRYADMHVRISGGIGCAARAS